MAQTPEQKKLSTEAGKVFTPYTPVNDDEMFTARIAEVRRVVDVINSRGRHAVIYGERGVGKTSLSNILASRIDSTNKEEFPRLAPRINCDGDDTFASLWRKIFSQIDLLQQKRAAGFQNTIFHETIQAADVVPPNPTAEDIRRMLTLLGEDKLVYLIFDEFDRVTEQGVRRAMADTIKTLSDNNVAATILLIGVGDDIEELINEHESIDRAIDQIKIVRMRRAEVHELLEKGAAKLGMRVTAQAHLRIALLCQGLPHYAHLLALHAVRAAIDADTKVVEVEHVRSAITSSVSGSHHMLRSDLQKATASPQKENIFNEVLLACSMAPVDEFGFFYAAGVRDPLSMIMKKRYEIPYFAKHLNEFCQASRGPVLDKHGEKRKFRYRFHNPLLQPLIIMKGIAEKRISEVDLEEMEQKGVSVTPAL